MIFNVCTDYIPVLSSCPRVASKIIITNNRMKIIAHQIIATIFSPFEQVISKQNVDKGETQQNPDIEAQI